jgi:hypothetical protein
MWSAYCVPSIFALILRSKSRSGNSVITVVWGHDPNWGVSEYRGGMLPTTVATRSEAWTVFALLNAGIVGSNPIQDMDVCLRLFCVSVVLCVGSGLASGWSPVQGVLPTVLGLRNWNETQRLTDAPYSPKWEQQERERERKNVVHYLSIYLAIYDSTSLFWTLAAFSLS